MFTLEELSRCGSIREWVGIHDPRLESITGTPAPNRGLLLRENWNRTTPGLRAAAEITRLVIPDAVHLTGNLQVSLVEHMHRTEPTRFIRLHFGETRDWHTVFPLVETSRLPGSDEDWNAWAGMAVCSETVGLAVFAQDAFADVDRGDDPGGIVARVQPVPAEMMRRLNQLQD